jgi:hypothetical protein
MIMNACTRIILSLTVVALAVLAGPLPTAEARGGHGGGGHGGHGGKGPKPAAHARTPARNPGRAVARRPGLNGRVGFRVGWAGRPVGNYWLGRGFYGVNWYTPGVSSWVYPGYVYRTPVYVTNPTTVIYYATSPGFSGGFDTTVPTSDPQSCPAQPVVLPVQN